MSRPTNGERNTASEASTLTAPSDLPTVDLETVMSSLNPAQLQGE